MKKLRAPLKNEDFKILIEYHSIKGYLIFEALIKKKKT